MTQNVDKAVAICLGLDCKQPTRYVRDINAKHNPQCAKYIFTLQQIMNSQTLKEYPPNEFGQIVKQRLKKCKDKGKQGYLQVILDDFKNTVEKIIKGIKDDLSTVCPLNHLQKCYNEVYSLEPIKSLIREKASSALITQQLKLMNSTKKISKLKQTNEHLDDINKSLGQITFELSNLVTDFKKNALMMRKDFADKKDLQKLFSIDEVIYGVAKTNYIGGRNIEFQGGWICFPSCAQNAFKPWVFSEKGFSTGIHKLKIISQKPLRSTNCGIAIIKQSDLHAYPYSNYKSLYDRVTRQFKLTNGQQLYTFIDINTQIYLTMDLNEKKAILYDRDKRCEYMCTLKQSTLYYFALVGSDWKARILHLS